LGVSTVYAWEPPVAESVWDYPRPPSIEAEPRRVRVEAGGVTLVDDATPVTAQVIRETSHPPVFYLPPTAVRMDRLRESGRRSTYCEWKGHATYWDLLKGDGETVVEAIAWSYARPVKRYRALRDHLAFYPSKLERAVVDGQVVEAQPGDFYGGWITPEVEGPFKGGRARGGGELRSAEVGEV
jgi:uncharacterized protein (DUF427 family)